MELISHNWRSTLKHRLKILNNFFFICNVILHPTELQNKNIDKIVKKLCTVFKVLSESLFFSHSYHLTLVFFLPSYVPICSPLGTVSNPMTLWHGDDAQASYVITKWNLVLTQIDKFWVWAVSSMSNGFHLFWWGL